MNCINDNALLMVKPVVPNLCSLWQLTKKHCLFSRVCKLSVSVDKKSSKLNDKMFFVHALKNTYSDMKTTTNRMTLFTKLLQITVEK